MNEDVSGYSIVKKLGTGARSQVYQAIRQETGEVFALKRVFRDTGEDTRFLDQAIQEHEVSSQFNHPYLRRSFELKRIRSLFRLVEIQCVMEFVDGVSLEKTRPEQIEKTVLIFVKIAEGLQYMHGLGFLHTDIKPNNILQTLDGGIKIIDFGQSCPIGFRKPRIQGTPDYIAPEQVERQPLSPRTDVFNLGATLYWTLTGRAYPTVISRQGERQDAIPADAIPQPHELIPEILPALSRLAMDCCAYDRFARPADMKDVLSRLATVQFMLNKSADAEVDDGTKEKRQNSPRPEAYNPRKDISGGDA